MQSRITCTIVLLIALMVSILNLYQPGTTSLFIPASHTSDASRFRQDLPSEWQMIGQVGGPTEAVAVQGNYAYLAVGLRVVVLDISDSAHPLQIGCTPPFPSFVESISLEGTLAFVSAGDAGLRIVDISMPSHPLEVGAWDSPGYAEGAVVTGNYVFLADGPYGLQILDVSHPAQPIPISSAYSTDYVFGLTVVGKIAYLAAGGAGILFVDVSNPLYPVEMSSFETPGYAYEVTVTQSTAYVADGWDGIRVLDVTDVRQPREIGAYQTPGQAFDISILGARAYVADAFEGLQILDLSNPVEPRPLGGYSQAKGHAGNLAVVGDTVFVADYYWGLWIVRVSNPSAPTEIGSYKPFGKAVDVAISGYYGYVAAGDYGIHAISLVNPALPVEVSALSTEYNVCCLAIDGHFAYAPTMMGNRLYILNISDPYLIHLVGTASVGDGATRDMSISGGFAYLANEKGLSIVDISDPVNPHKVSYIYLIETSEGNPGTAAVGVVVQNGLAYIASENAGIKIVDVSQPSNPTVIGNFRADGVNDVAVVGNLAYLVGVNNLVVVDVSDPRNPIERTSISLPVSAEKVTYLDNMLYLSLGNLGIATADLSNPLSPTINTSYNTPGYVYNIAADSGYVYVADADGGISVLQKRTAFQALPPSAVSIETELLVTSLYPPTPIVASEDMRQKPARSLFTAGTPEICTVTSTADGGAGTLRQCLESAQSGTTINFDISVFPPAHPQIITLSTGLPQLEQGHITLDGSNAGVIIDGSNTSANTSGLRIESSYNVIEGLQIIHFPGDGIHFGENSSFNQVGGDRTTGSGPLGEGNLISGNQGFAGIEINAFGSGRNLILGNLIGTDITGSMAYPNSGFGIFLGDLGADGNQIGSGKPGERNIVSGNGSSGIALLGFGSKNNIISGNYVGLDILGNKVLVNKGYGISMEAGSHHNVIDKNVVITQVTGVQISDPGSSYNTITGNFIGADATGTTALGDGYSAIAIGGGAAFNRIGGKMPEDRNVIAGGIWLYRRPGIGNLILGNYLGIKATGTDGFKKPGSGIGLDGSRYVFIGGNTPGEKNVIGGNNAGGVAIYPGVEDIFVVGNNIGTDASGLNPVQNGGDNFLLNNAEHIFIQKNVIAYNYQHGIRVVDTGSNTIRQNSIFSNTIGIQNVNGGNESLPAPVITMTAIGLTGMTCPECTVEFFLDGSDEGQVYQGSSLADSNGNFSHVKFCPATLPNLTATATDSKGNTSQFSVPQPVTWDCSSANPAPNLESVDPTSATAGGNTFLITLTGSGFAHDAVALWNGNTLISKPISSTEILAIVPSLRINTGGTVSLTISNPEPGGGMSDSLDFMVYNPVPTIERLNPTNIVPGSQGSKLSIQGTGFVADSVVQEDGIGVTTTFVSSTQLLADLPASVLAISGELTITVINPQPGGGSSNTATVRIGFLKVFLPVILK